MTQNKALVRFNHGWPARPDAETVLWYDPSGSVPPVGRPYAAVGDLLATDRTAAEDWIAQQNELAAAWDEGHGHCFHVEKPDADGNPYRI